MTDRHLPSLQEMGQRTYTQQELDAAVEAAREECVHILEAEAASADKLAGEQGATEIDIGVVRTIAKARTIANTNRIQARKIRALNVTGALDRERNRARLEEHGEQCDCRYVDGKFVACGRRAELKAASE